MRKKVLSVKIFTKKNVCSCIEIVEIWGLYGGELFWWFAIFLSMRNKCGLLKEHHPKEGVHRTCKGVSFPSSLSLKQYQFENDHNKKIELASVFFVLVRVCL